MTMSYKVRFWELRERADRRKGFEGRWKERFGVAPDGRLFRNAAGNCIEAAAYGITWGRAREATVTLDEHALSLAKRPYDLRHGNLLLARLRRRPRGVCAQSRAEHPGPLPLLREVPGRGAQPHQHVDRAVEAAVGRAGERCAGRAPESDLGPEMPRNRWSEVGQRWEISGEAS